MMGGKLTLADRFWIDDNDVVGVTIDDSQAEGDPFDLEISGNEGVGKAADVPFLRKAQIIGPFGRGRQSHSERQFKNAMHAALKKAGAEVSEFVKAEFVKLGKAAPSDDSDLDRILDGLPLDSFDSVQEVVSDYLASAGLDAADEFGAGINLGDMVDQVNQGAVDYANQRAAELVSDLSDGTRDMVRATIADGLANNIGADQIAQNLVDTYAFSEDRASTIAHYEIGTANSAASLSSAQAVAQNGVEVLKAWITAGDNKVDADICRANADQGYIALGSAFQSGHQHPLGHPRCRCALTYRVNSDD